MKLSPTRNGRYTFTIQPVHRIDSEDVATILAIWVDWELDEDREPIFPAISKAAAERMIREQLKETGQQGRELWTEKVDENYVSERAAWAVEAVRRLWPELDDDILAEFERSFVDRDDK